MTGARRGLKIAAMGILVSKPQLSEDESEALVWALFSLRVDLAESAPGPRRDALALEERQLVRELGAEIDPLLHVDVAPSKAHEHVTCF